METSIILFGLTLVISLKLLHFLTNMAQVYSCIDRKLYDVAVWQENHWKYLEDTSLTLPLLLESVPTISGKKATFQVDQLKDLGLGVPPKD